MNKRITIKQIAKALSVSISTVSKALNDSYEISDETKKKIQEYAKLHKYKPNTLALSLQNKRTKTIGIIIPNILNYYFARVLRGIEKATTERGYNIVTCITNESHKKEVDTMEMLSNGTIDGFIACLSTETLKKKNFDHFQSILEEGTPVVLYGRVHKKIHCDKVVTDNIKSAYKATRFLMKSECKNIALVTTSVGLKINKFRIKGYLKALTKYGITPNESIIIKQENEKGLKERINKMLDTNEVDGIFTIDEVSGAIVTQVLNKRNIKIPEDISIIGFTNGILSRYSTPPLTSVNRFAHTTGEVAANRLIDKIEEKIEFKDIKTEIIRTKLVERDSTKKMFVQF
ncbi:MAG: LacI family DNA-binding transcriptional regulator [Lutibacter sp.]|uniref:LacI family DNA-binding transcriptional regulator n=1 Tax=Lutibacter sp. TaxID=1925666 RepID=UPI0019DD5B14|nr:LacI family DNA-binding transcriptional regulator [Lutibacter sp.]NOR28830.1 LacI family DNA-binding transcriptional regulator [Lutibacter sp.]